ncbi:MAG: tyrosine-type recombinase/integrase, partial [Eubacterium sp.]
YARSYHEVVKKLEEAEAACAERVALQRMMRKHKNQKDSQFWLFLKEEGSHSMAENMGLKSWLLYWLSHKKGVLKRSSYTQYHSVIHLYLIPKLGHIPLGRLNSQLIQEYVKEMMTPEGRGLAPATVRRHLSVLSSALKQALKEEKIKSNPCTNVVVPVIRRKEVRVLSTDEYRRLEQSLYETFENPRSAAILLTLKTGLRLGELAALQWDAIDFNKKAIRVRDALHRVKTETNKESKTEIIFEGPKSNSSARLIPMNQEIEKILKRHQKISEKQKKDGGFVFSDTKGSFIDPRAYQMYLKKILKRAEVTYINFHSLRHTFATVAAEKDMQISVLSRILGHANIGTTLKLYVHPHLEQDWIEMGKLSD